MSRFDTTRYAVYFTPPPGPLWELASTWLGWDSAAGAPREMPPLPDLPRPREEITAAPRKYGFHATLKPPFHLNPDAHRENLQADIEALAAELAPLALGHFRISRLGRFLALTPVDAPPQLRSHAAAVVELLDGYRARPDEAELGRRRKSGLTPEEEANLTRWGYPYVMDAFRFHMTLTGAMPADELTLTESALTNLFAPHLEQPFTLDAFTLLASDPEGRFHQIARIDLTGRA